MFRRVMVVAILLGCDLVPAEAAFKGCYERVYDKRYLRKHRRQDIVKLRLQIGVGGAADAPPEYFDRIDGVTRKGVRYKGGPIECAPGEDEVACVIKGEGGSFVLTDRGNNSLRVTNTNFMRFGDQDDGITIKAKGDNREFRLFRISVGACP
jgi:hypothetical protein